MRETSYATMVLHMTKTYCTGSGTFPTEESTATAREAYRLAYIARYPGSLERGDDNADPAKDNLYGRKGCPMCGKAYFVKKDGTLPRH